MKGRGVADSRKQGFRAQQPRGDLAPLSRDTMGEVMALGGELSRGSGTSVTSNSILASGMGVSAGHSVVPKQACAASLGPRSVLELTPAQELDRVLHAHHPEIATAARDAVVNGITE